ncbi:nucleoside triphosphate pyrophosphatase [Polynucleobacter sp. AM-26B4]|uniref:Maf family protein n=1 Tax=Polynucleobacter sp. AM-26B4 TaxID=2689103 RepID=UPI001C0B1F94|nr:Maf family protein [Polynucleobacter sp. AM-26B4]MBU3585045.1 septum formation inhibitor Maf [Polynucleobacter sp. AM-26B4]
MHSLIYLASQSPRRQELLKQIGVKFQLLLADSSEDAESLEAQLSNEPALVYVKRVTLAKLSAAKQRLHARGLDSAPILCADTTVALMLEDGKEIILGKPTDRKDAKRILQLLSGKTHQVHTAVAVLGTPHMNDAQPKLLVSSSQVTFKSLSDAEIDAYISSNEPMGKAGAYGIQGIGGCLISSISGSYSGIMGLPLFETSQLLNETGVQFSLRP